MLLPSNVVYHSMQISSNSSRLVGIFSDEVPSFFLHLPDFAQWVVDLLFHLVYRFKLGDGGLGWSGSKCRYRLRRKF